jgi:hypothetical protein
MTEQEYEAYRQRSVPAYAADLGRNSRAEALCRSLGHVTGWTPLSKPLQEQP